MADSRLSRQLAAASAALLAATLAVAGATRPAASVAFLLALALMSSLVLAKRFPAQALTCGVFALIIASTKFRHRPATASLAAKVDGQVVLELALYALFAVTLVVVVRAAGLRLGRLGRAELLLLGYVALAALSTAWSAAPLMTVTRSLQLAIVYGAALVYVRLLDPARVVRTLSAPLAWYVIAFACLAAVFPWAAGERVTYQGVVRFSWFAVHPITAATFAGIAAVSLSSRIMNMRTEQEGHRRVWFLLGAFALVGITLLTRSRGPLIGMMGGLGMIVMAPRLRGGAVAFLTAAILIAALVFEASGMTVGRVLDDWSADDGTVASMVFRGQTADDVIAFSGRAELWADAVSLFLERPWLGSGYQASRADLLNAMPWAAYAHNTAMQSLLDLGLPGFLLLFLAFGSIFAVGPVRGPGVDSALRGARITVLAIGTFELLNGISSEAYAAAPGYETLIVLTCVCLAERLRRHPRARHSRQLSRADRSRAAATAGYWPKHGRRAAAAVKSPMRVTTSRLTDRGGV